MAQTSQRRRSSSVDARVAVDAIPMKGIKPIWYAVGGGCVLVGLAIALVLSVGGGKKETAAETPAVNMPSSVDLKEEAAERRRHLEITQRSLERLKDAEDQKQPVEPHSQAKQPSAASTAAAGAEPAPGAAPAAPAPQPKPQTKELDKLDSIGADIQKELGK